MQAREDNPPREAFIGRRHELARIDRGLADAKGGRGSIFLLAGEPGIGKSTLAREASARAEDHGFAVAWGRGWEVGGAPTFWPWIQIVRELARSDDSLKPILSDLIAATPGANVNVAEGRFRLFDDLTLKLQEAARARPLFIVLDDAHAADPSSLALLLFVARHLASAPICVVVTYRDQETRADENTAQTLGLVSREAQSLALARFDPAEVRTFLEQRAGGAVADDLVDAVVQTTEGHPLFVDEVTRSWLAQAPGAAKSAGLAVPRTVRDAIHARILRLAARTRSVLACAAVLGREVDAQVLADLRPDLARSDLAHALAAGVTASVLVQSEPDTHTFSHALVRDALYLELPPEERRALHARAAVALERSSATSNLKATVLAHWLAAGAEASLDALVRAAMHAAEHAMQAYAFEDAVTLLESAIPAIEAKHAEPRVLAEALILLGEARARSRRDASEPCRRAAEIGQRLGDPDIVARAALALGSEIVPAVVNSSLVELLRTALNELPPEPSVARARVSARLAGAMQPARDPRVPMALAREAIAMARGLGDRAALRLVLLGAGSALVDFALPAERLEIDTETLRLAEEVGDTAIVFRAQVRLFMDAIEIGKGAAADRAAAAMERLGADLRRPKYQWYGFMMQAAQALHRGQVLAAEALEAKARQVAATTRDDELVGLDFLYTTARAVLCGSDEPLRACFDGFASYVGDAADDIGVEHFVAPFIRARMGDTKGLETTLARAPAWGFATIDPLGMYMLSEIRFAAEIADGAETLLRDLAVRRGLFLTWGATALLALGPVDWLLARLASLLGRWPEAERDFESAIAQCAAVGAQTALVHVRTDYGIALARKGDAARADAQLERAVALANQLGLDGLAKRAEARRSRSAPVAPTAGALAQTPKFSLERDGEIWTVTRDDSVFRIKDTRGMSMLAELVARPGEPIHVLLFGGQDPGDLGDAGPLLDAQAVRAYRTRLDDLREIERDAEASSDTARAARARAEIEAVAAELSSGLGLGGKNRRAASAVERARSNIQRRIKDAIRRIKDHDAELGRYLSWTVRTGTFCVFDPESKR